MSTTEQPVGASRATAVVICCFAAWGIASDMTAPMVAAFKRIFMMSTLQASLVQFAYYGAYLAPALPAAFINQRCGYKTARAAVLASRRISGGTARPHCA